MRKFGQDEYYDFYNPEIEDVGVDYVEPYVDIYAFDYDPGTGFTETIPAEDYPSEIRYVTNYQEQQAAIQVQATSGAGFFDIFKSILGLAAPVITSAMRAGQTPTTTLPKISTGLPVKTAGLSLSSLTSNPLLLIGLGLGGFLLLRGRGKGRRK